VRGRSIWITSRLGDNRIEEPDGVVEIIAASSLNGRPTLLFPIVQARVLRLLRPRREGSGRQGNKRRFKMVHFKRLATKRESPLPARRTRNMDSEIVSWPTEQF